jgi:integrase
VTNYVAAFLEDHVVATGGPTRGRRKSASTIKTYRGALKRFSDEHGGRRLDDLDRPLARRIAAAYPVSNMVVIRNMFARAHDDGLIDTNPFADLQLEHSDGRAANEVMSDDDLHRLADGAIGALGPELGPVWRAGILFAAYVGPRLESFCTLEWRDLDLNERHAAIRPSSVLDRESTPRLTLRFTPSRPSPSLKWPMRRTAAAFGRRASPSAKLPTPPPAFVRPSCQSVGEATDPLSRRAPRVPRESVAEAIQVRRRSARNCRNVVRGIICPPPCPSTSSPYSAVGRRLQCWRGQTG